MGSNLKKSRWPGVRRRESERTKILIEAARLQKRVNSGRPLTDKDMEDAIKLSKKMDEVQSTKTPSEKQWEPGVRCASCHGKVTVEQAAWRRKSHPRERMLCTGCAMSV